MILVIFEISGKTPLLRAVSYLAGLPDFGLNPKNLGSFEGDGIFLGVYFFEKAWDKSWEVQKLLLKIFVFIRIADSYFSNY